MTEARELQASREQALQAEKDRVVEMRRQRVLLANRSASSTRCRCCEQSALLLVDWRTTKVD